MRNMVPYSRVPAPRRLPRIVPALGALALSLAAGALLFPRAAAPDVAEAAPSAPSPIGPILVDLGPHAPTGFAPRSARARPHNVFVARAAAATPAQAATATQTATPTQAAIIAETPTPPIRPAELRGDTTVAIAAPETPVSADVPTPPRRPAELSVASRGAPEQNVASRAPAAEQSVVAARAVAPQEQQQQPQLVAPPRAALPPQPPRQVARTTVVPAAPADRRGFFERLFGGAPQAAAPQAASRPSRETMAYAAPDAGGLFGGLRSAVAPANPASRYDRYTAIYDISAHTVYLPDGTRLEAHSGLREHLDDPRYVHLRMRGATPPHLYDLTPREALFHGVEALRLNPVGGGGGAIYNRAGLLAHTYMLGPNGDSNGCVSFRDYNAFLNAYKRGQIRRLAVVAHL